MMADRESVLWIGDPPPSRAEAVFLSRRLSLHEIQSPTASDYNAARAVIINVQRVRGASLPALNLIDPILTNGFRPIIRCPSFAFPRIQKRLVSRTSRFDIRRTEEPLEQLAELARQVDTDPGMPLNETLEIGGGAALEPEDEALLRRAFGDCTHVDLYPLTEGKSDARVFRAHVRLGRYTPTAGGGHAPYMLPFLVKLDATEEVASERQNIQNYVLPHIPFSQRPNIDSKRCLLGANRGILVGDFVDEAVPLSKICDRNTGRAAVYSLFDDALRSWRRHAYNHDRAEFGAFPELMSGLIREASITTEICSIAKSLGSRATPTEIVKRLSVTSKFNYRVGTIHGDLHPGNVMVRNGESILIDFASIWNKAPLIADLACLEIAMCFTVATEKLGSVGLKNRKFRNWAKAIDYVFAGECLRQVPPLQDTPDQNNWMWSACRQTRSMVPQVGADSQHYAAALVAYLLRRARLGGRDGENKNVAAYALYTAEKVLICLESRLC